jgi:hypothetical protein
MPTCWLNRTVSGYDEFAPIYDAWSADMTEDVDVYVAHAAEFAWVAWKPA